jgi:hypothetical protein
MLTPNYSTLMEAEMAVAQEVTALTTGQLNTPEAVHAAWIVVGYGLSLAVPGTAAPHAMAAAPKAAPNFNWGGLLLTLLPVLQQILQGVLAGQGGKPPTP